MGDTENDSWGSRELGGSLRREEARREYERPMREDEVVPFLLRVLVHIALTRDPENTQDAYNAAYDCVSDAIWEVERGS